MHIYRIIYVLYFICVVYVDIYCMLYTYICVCVREREIIHWKNKIAGSWIDPGVVRLPPALARKHSRRSRTPPPGGTQFSVLSLGPWWAVLAQLNNFFIPETLSGPGFSHHLLLIFLVFQGPSCRLCLLFLCALSSEYPVTGLETRLP